MIDERCKWNGSGNPRTVPGRHDGACQDEACRGCAPCPSSHCRVCGTAHSAGTCPECMAEVRDNLREIGRLCDGLPEEVEHRGVEGEAMMLLAHACNPEARGHLEASVLAGRLDKYDRDGNLVRSGMDMIEATHLGDCADPRCVGCAGELNPEFVLGSWESVWRDALEHDEPDELFDLAATVDYLDRTMSYMGDYPHVPFEDYAADLRRCRAHLASPAVLHDESRGDPANIGCFECGDELERLLRDAKKCRHATPARAWLTTVRSYPEIKVRWTEITNARRACADCDQGGFEDHWTCRKCKRQYTIAEYNFALRAELEGQSA